MGEERIGIHSLIMACECEGTIEFDAAKSMLAELADLRTKAAENAVRDAKAAALDDVIRICTQTVHPGDTWRPLLGVIAPFLRDHPHA